ncbi:hypothetical protein Agub_g6715, partial [Astrephomene gubernaculifera]
TPEPHWLDMYLAACQPMLRALCFSQLASLAVSLGRLGVAPPEHWVQELLQAAEVALPSAGSAGKVAAVLTWVAEEGRVVPDAAWVGAALQQIHSLMQQPQPQPQHPSQQQPDSHPPSSPLLSPSQATDVAWAVATLGYRPAQPLLDGLAAATLGRASWGGAAGGGGEGATAAAAEEA